MPSDDFVRACDLALVEVRRLLSKNGEWEPRVPPGVSSLEDACRAGNDFCALQVMRTLRVLREYDHD